MIVLWGLIGYVVVSAWLAVRRNNREDHQRRMEKTTPAEKSVPVADVWYIWEVFDAETP